MRLAVIGSRSWQDAKLLDRVLAEYRGRVACVISGGADGADKMGARWARKNGVAIRVFEPDHKNRKHAYHHRNRLIVENCDELVAFWDGRSSGSAYTIDYARRLGKPVRIVRPGAAERGVQNLLTRQNPCSIFLGDYRIPSLEQGYGSSKPVATRVPGGPQGRGAERQHFLVRR